MQVFFVVVTLCGDGMPRVVSDRAALCFRGSVTPYYLPNLPEVIVVQPDCRRLLPFLEFTRDIENQTFDRVIQCVVRLRRRYNDAGVV
jgi:hypothetical protein